MCTQGHRPSIVRTSPPPVSKGPIAEATCHPRIPPGEVPWGAPLHPTTSGQAYEG